MASTRPSRPDRGSRVPRWWSRVARHAAARRYLAVGLVAVYVVVVVAANVLTSRFGVVWVAPGLAGAAGSYAAGAALFARDVLHDVAGRRVVLAAILLAALLSALLAGAHLALASGVAFVLSEVLDTAVYVPLRARGWTRAVLVSNAVGAVVDTVVFLSVAGFGLTRATVGGQLVAKLCWATVLPVVVVWLYRYIRRRSVP